MCVSITPMMKFSLSNEIFNLLVSQERVVLSFQTLVDLLVFDSAVSDFKGIHAFAGRENEIRYYAFFEIEILLMQGEHGSQCIEML